MATKIQKWGNSLAVRLPRELAQKFRLREGSDVALREERNSIAIINIPTRAKPLQKADWRKFVLPAKKKKENVSGKIDKIFYGAKIATFDKQMERLAKKI